MSEPQLKRVDLKSSQDALDELGNESAAYMDSSSFARTTEQAVLERLNQGKVVPTVFQRVVVAPHEEHDEETAHLCRELGLVAALRAKWLFTPQPPPPGVIPHTRPFDPFHAKQEASSYHTCRMVHGVVQVFAPHDKECLTSLFPVLSLHEFYNDLRAVMRLVEGPAKSLAFARLSLLEKKFETHLLLNEAAEIAAVKLQPRRDFYNVRKVDTHIHHSAIMNEKHLLKFIKKKLQTEPNETVIFRDDKYLTLRQVFESLSLNSDTLSVNSLDCHADRRTFHRFDRFNLKYNPAGEARLRMIFLKTDNLISGRYFAEITSEVFRGYERAKYIYAEPRLSIYGRNLNEWSKLGNWVVTHKVYSDQVRFFVQIPRLYNVYREANEISCFADMLRNIFLPLFEVTVNPNVDWKLHLFLQQLVGFDSVDDESKTEFMWKDAAPTATEWVSAQNPPYSYYLYYLQANLKCLNQLREARGFRTFALRPHSGEAGPTNHLAAAFLVAENISHGITLRKAPVLQYLYYLTNIGVSVSPISNNKLFLEFSRSPFLAYFKQGLNVTLTTDDPLQFHLSEHPLIEEYSTAMHVFKLSPHDICEIARNSVLISGFEHAIKLAWLGPKYQLWGPVGNDPLLTNVPDIRLRYRQETLVAEIDFILRNSKLSTSPERNDSYLEALRAKYLGQ